MALSSGGWAPPAPATASSQQASCGGPAPTACCSTVLMSVRVSVCHSGIRPLCLPGAGSEALRLQLSMDPSRAGEFRLALRDTSGNRSVVRLHTHSPVCLRRVHLLLAVDVCVEPPAGVGFVFSPSLGLNTPFYGAAAQICAAPQIQVHVHIVTGGCTISKELCPEPFI